MTAVTLPCACVCVCVCVISVSLHCYAFPFVFPSSRKYCDHSWSRRRWWIMIGVKRAEEHGEGILTLRNPSGHQGGRWGPWWLRWKRRFSCFCTGVSSSVPLWPSVTWWCICVIARWPNTLFICIFFTAGGLIFMIWFTMFSLVCFIFETFLSAGNPFPPHTWSSNAEKKHTRKVYYQTELLGCAGVASRKSLGKVELSRRRK